MSKQEAQEALDRLQVSFSDVGDVPGTAWNVGEVGSVQIIIDNPLEDYSFVDLVAIVEVNGPAKIGPIDLRTDPTLGREQLRLSALGPIEGSSVLGPGGRAYLPFVWIAAEAAGGVGLSVGLTARVQPIVSRNVAGRTLLTIAPS